MVITFVSNYINHHQLPFCRAMSSFGEEAEFYFVQVMPMEEKRKSMGWAVDEGSIPYLVLYYEEPERAKKLILESDVVLFGWTEGRISDLEQERLSSGKLAFRVSERIYREGRWKFISPRGLAAKYKEHIRYRNKPVYLLCTGAYVASDFSLIKSYPGKMLKWGYFPDASSDIAEKSYDAEPVNICWAGRLIELKHPEYAVRLAGRLKSLGIDCSMKIVGDGPLKQKLEEMVKDMGLEDTVELTGGKRPDEVLQYMAEAQVFLFTSNYLEGWGAVVNEAMQKGCALVASSEAGAVPFLIENGRNGRIYENGDYDNFEKAALSLVRDRKSIKVMGQRAAETINETWNADVAARELVRFCREYVAGETPTPAEKGPMSRAEVIKAPGMRRTLEEKNHLE